MKGRFRNKLERLAATLAIIKPYAVLIIQFDQIVPILILIFSSFVLQYRPEIETMGRDRSVSFFKSLLLEYLAVPNQRIYLY